MPTNDGTLIFLHSYKTGGTALRHILTRYYPESAIYNFYRSQNHPPLEALTLEARKEIRLCSSHEPLGAHDRYLTPPIQYITMLRDPVERVISEHHYRIRRGLQGSQGNLPLITISEQMKLGHQDNLQVRQLSGQGYVGEVTDLTLEQANANLCASFMTFGLVDRFAESLLLFRHKFGWKDVPISIRLNQTPRPQEQPLDPLTRRTIAEHHAFDMQLVDTARTHFAMRLDDADITAADVAKFTNSWVTKARAASFLSTLMVKRSWRMIKEQFISKTISKNIR